MLFLGHSENRIAGETDEDINKKIHSALNKKFKSYILHWRNVKRKKKENYFFSFKETN